MQSVHRALTARTAVHHKTPGVPPWYSDAPVVHAKDHVYLLEHGLIYASPCIASQHTSRCSASILLTLERKPFKVTFRDKSYQFKAVAVRPLVERSLHAENAALISVLVHPNHPEFSRFRTIVRPGYMELDRETFAHLDDSLRAAAAGTLPLQRSAELLDQTIAAVVCRLPNSKRPDPRVERVIELLRENPNRTLSDLAETVGLSCNRMSHLFADVVGLPWRSYVLWQKVLTAALMLTSGRRLTEIAMTAGFADSAHLSNTWQQAFGASPSQFLNSEYVELHFEGNRLQASRAAAGLGSTPQQRVCPHCGSTLTD